ncbi:MAG: D-hexose-6-phosphate mutarotase [Desulfobulbaceae bacterium]|nr:D-hexose-6-phosphate mutarotase [Desulfobulbaceae bacterium]
MIEQKKRDNGLEYIEVRNAQAQAKIALQGAHLFHYQRENEDPLIWLSDASFFETGKAIRGGIPICWPWFGKHPSPKMPQHGFARTALWELLEVEEASEDETELTLQLHHLPEHFKLWPHRFELRLHITIGRSLTLALTTTNCDEQSFTITSALHSYFAVSDIQTISIEGLENTPYLDTVTNRREMQTGRVRITQEVDRIHQQVQSPLTLHDLDRTVTIRSEGSSSVVVWNPWVDKCARMADMHDGAYRTMVCIETANALDDAQSLDPGAEHTLAVLLS